MLTNKNIDGVLIETTIFANLYFRDYYLAKYTKYSFFHAFVYPTICVGIFMDFVLVTFHVIVSTITLSTT